MQKLLKVIPIGDELGVILPQEILDFLGVRPGDEIDIEETPEGFLLLPPKS